MIDIERTLTKAWRDRSKRDMVQYDFAAFEAGYDEGVKLCRDYLLLLQAMRQFSASFTIDESGRRCIWIAGFGQKGKKFPADLDEDGVPIITPEMRKALVIALRAAGSTSPG